MRISKVYTRNGDEGRTRLAGGQEVFKNDPRVETYGTIDELNGVIGAARAFIADHLQENTQLTLLDQELHSIQSKLFDVGGVLATPSEQPLPSMPQITDNNVTHLETLIDSMNEELAPLKEFILPGGGKATSFLHMARTVCRRAERQCVSLSHHTPVEPIILKYLNRLSDALFVFARWAAKAQKTQEHFWKR